MGMSASQGRFLMLTAQKNNNEYQAQRITFERSRLAQEADGWVMDYNESLSNKTLLFNQQGKNGNQVNYSARLTYDDITKDPKDNGLGLTLISTAGKIIVPELPSKEKMEQEGTKKSDYMIIPDVKDLDFLEKNIREGNFMFAAPEINSEKKSGMEAFKTFDLTSIHQVSDMLDITDDAEQQNKYDQTMRLFHRSDKLLECQLNKLDTEHTALQTELESVQKVIKDNVESSFKTFG